MERLIFLVVSTFVTSLMISLVMFIAWRNYGRQRYVLAWSITYFLGAMQWGLMTAAHSIFASSTAADFIASISGIVVVSVGLVGCFWWAGRPLQLRWVVIAGVTMIAAVASTTFVWPHAGLRHAIGPIYTAMLCLLNSITIWRRSQQVVAAEVGAATVFFVFALTQLVAASLAYLQGPEHNASFLSWSQQLTVIAISISSVTIGLFSILILSSDLSRSLEKRARIDELTGVMNRRGFNESAAPMLARARRYDEALSLVLCDIDWFKTINDGHGHLTGDRVLADFAEYLASAVRDGDVVARIGGEEFALLLPRQNIEAARATAERLRAGMAEIEALKAHTIEPITASFGLTTLHHSDDSVYDMFARADQAMYRAKDQGRNRVSAG